MCGRYYIEIDEKELREICNEVEKNTVGMEQISLKTSGEIFPTDVVPVQTGINRYTPMTWGFIGFNSRPIINARSETALDKPTFRLSMLERRCIIPASGYYEWKKEENKKQKYVFYLKGQPIYLAGCFQHEMGNTLSSFVILTKNAENGIELIHDRMPVIIPQNRISDWFNEGVAVLDSAVTELEYMAV